MDIIVTTPKAQMRAAAQEAADAVAAGGGEYFRRFPDHANPNVVAGDRVYYVEDGYVRGYALVSRVKHRSTHRRCDTTGRLWLPGYYVYMPANTWTWIRPIPMRGFQGFRYAQACCEAGVAFDEDMEIIGGWLDPRPRMPCRTPYVAGRYGAVERPGRINPTEADLGRGDDASPVRTMKSPARSDCREVKALRTAGS